MESDTDHARLVEQAQLGDEKCLEQLTRAAQERLRVDVYRLTLDAELTGDIVQETILEMLKILSELKEADKFWPWLYRIALNKIRHHRRSYLASPQGPDKATARQPVPSKITIHSHSA